MLTARETENLINEIVRQVNDKFAELENRIKELEASKATNARRTTKKGDS